MVAATQAILAPDDIFPGPCRGGVQISWRANRSIPRQHSLETARAW